MKKKPYEQSERERSAMKDIQEPAMETIIVDQNEKVYLPHSLHRDCSAAAWINQQSELRICVRTMPVGPAVRIYEGHHVIGTGETLEEAVAAAIQKQQNATSALRRGYADWLNKCTICVLCCCLFSFLAGITHDKSGLTGVVIMLVWAIYTIAMIRWGKST